MIVVRVLVYHAFVLRSPHFLDRGWDGPDDEGLAATVMVHYSSSCFPDRSEQYSSVCQDMRTTGSHKLSSPELYPLPRFVILFHYLLIYRILL